MLESPMFQPSVLQAKVRNGVLQRLQNAAYEVIVDAARGGLIHQIIWKGTGRPVNLLYCPDSMPAASNGIDLFGCWPLVPFANRCFGGRLMLGDAEWTLPINEPSSGNAMHGLGWQCRWDIEDASADSLTLRHRCEDGFGPFRYRCELQISIDDHSVSIGLSVENEGDAALPFGLGLHPWFPCDRSTLFHVGGARAKVRFAAGYRARSVVPLDAIGDFLVDGVLDRDKEIVVNYIGWNGHATLVYPQDYRLTLTASPSFAMPLLWRPPGAAFMCFEPQSHVLGAPGDRQAGKISPMHVLDRGERLSGWLRMEAFEEPDDADMRLKA